MSILQKIKAFIAAPTVEKELVSSYDVRSEPPSDISRMTVDRLHQIIKTAEAGDTRDLFALYRNIIQADNHIQTEFSKRKLAVIGDPLSVIAADKKVPEDVSLATALQAQLKDCPDYITSMSHLMDSILYPVAVLQKQYRVTPQGYTLARLIPVLTLDEDAILSLVGRLDTALTGDVLLNIETFDLMDAEEDAPYYEGFCNLNLPALHAAILAAGNKQIRIVCDLENIAEDNSANLTLPQFEIIVKPQVRTGEEPLDPDPITPYPPASEILIQSDIGDTVASQTAVESAQTDADAAQATADAARSDADAAQADADAAQATANAAATKITGAMGVVLHGATAGTARPTGYGAITWIGSVEPTNAITNDIWEDTSV